MSDKRVCGVCREHGHTSAACPRMRPAGLVLTPLVVTARDVRCQGCELLEAEVAMLKRRLAERDETPSTRDVIASSRDETSPFATKRGRPRRYSSEAARKLAYRERHGSN